MTISVALIGFGAISRAVLAGLSASPEVVVRQILVRPGRVAETQALVGPSVSIITSIAEIAPDTATVLECAGHEAVEVFGGDILRRGMDFGVLSVGALADDTLRKALITAARDGQARLAVLPGAIGGTDALAAARDALTEVTYRSRKPPLSWSGTPAEKAHDLAILAASTEVYSGTAREAALQFPKNANVVATVALAGVGFENTRVTLIADPAARGNTHEIYARGMGFELSFTTSGPALPDNPKTSALTARSALRYIQGLAPGLTI